MHGSGLLKWCAILLMMELGWIPSHAAGQPAGEGGERYFAENGEPTYYIAQDGQVDWYTFNGYRRYHAECHMCHGVGGEGSTVAPPLLIPLKTMSFATFRDIIIHGLRSIGPAQEQVMRAMGEDRNVMCYLTDLYVYLKARADGALGRNRPDNHQARTVAAMQAETACLGNP